MALFLEVEHFALSQMRDLESARKTATEEGAKLVAAKKALDATKKELVATKKELDATKKALEHVECVGCSDRVLAALALRMPCCPSIVCCAQCVPRMFADGAMCPKPACRKLLDVSVYGKFLPASGSAAATVAKTSAIERKRMDRVTEFACPTDGCSGFIICARQTGLRFHACTRCSSIVCKDCKEPPSSHGGGASCPGVNPLLQQQLKDKGFKRCPLPGCRAVVERLDACNTVKCASCKTLFCWLCGLCMDNDAVPNASSRAHAHFTGKAPVGVSDPLRYFDKNSACSDRLWKTNKTAHKTEYTGWN
jgi:hypothetical protein